MRPAHDRDVDAIVALQRHAMLALGRAFYSEAQIAAALAHLPLADGTLIGEGHYFVMEEAGFGLVATGGWSLARPAYEARRPAEAGAQAACGPTVRLVFVHPARARGGLGARMMRFIEADAMAAGHRRLVLTATFSGVPLHRMLGFLPKAETELRLPGGLTFPVVAMTKALTGTIPLAA